VPLQVPTIDDRTFDDLLREALSRIPSHNPEWTNFNRSDPGVTILEVFSFLAESILYRANQIPERNRKKFLSLLGVPLQPATSARGLVTFDNERGPSRVFTLDAGLEVRAGNVPFRTERGLDVLPVEARVYYKSRLASPPPELLEQYNLLYATHRGSPPTTPVELYETVPFGLAADAPVDLGDTVGNALWIALLVRPVDNKVTGAANLARAELAGKTLSIGIAPAPASREGEALIPGGSAAGGGGPTLIFEVPRMPNAAGRLPASSAARVPDYRALATRAQADVTAVPGIVDVTLPASPADLMLWTNLEPLESGVGDFPPSIDDTEQAERLITWIRVRPPSSAANVRLLWMGINAAPVAQRARVVGEILPPSTGEPDQVRKLAQAPVLPGTVRLAVTSSRNETRIWTETADLWAAGPEVPVPDPRRPPGSPPPPPRPAHVFALDAEAGTIRFGDGTRGARPPRDATLRADYDYAVGAAGNVGRGSIATGPTLPSGMKVTNPLPTWGGADAESVKQGEKQIARFLQHRDRLVSPEDFVTIARRTPGLDVARVDVLPAFHPALSTSEPGDAPGAVTVMVVPRFDPKSPNAPQPDDSFLRTVACWLEPRRLVTTAVFIRGPAYQPIWIAMGIEVVAGVNAAEVREAVKRALYRHLSPVPPALEGPDVSGWPLRKTVVAAELAAVASRVPGVNLVNEVKLAKGASDEADRIPMRGLMLPRIAGIQVGDRADLDELREGPAATTPTSTVPVPFIPEECT
jgi:hypothetical protein